MKKLFVLAALFSFAFSGGYAQDAQEGQEEAVKLPQLTGEEFLKAESEKPVPAARTDEYGLEGDSIYVMLVGFDACKPCARAEKWLLVPLLKEYVEKKFTFVKIVKIDIKQDEARTKDINRRITQLFNIQKYPTILVTHDKEKFFFKEGFDIGQVDQLRKDIINAVSNAFKKATGKDIKQFH